MNGFTSKAVHGAVLKKDVHGALRFPLYDGAAFEMESSHDLELAFAGKKAAHSYTRISNPTVEEFEQKIRLLSGASFAVAVSSGMAAISEVVLALCEPGSNIVTSPYLFGNTVSLFENTLKRWGLEVRYCDLSKPDLLDTVIDQKTRLVFLEAISNPQMEVVDIAAICNQASGKSVPVVLDGTLTTPYLFRSKDHGVALEVISSTKYISGGATSVGGLIIDNGNFDWGRNLNLNADALKYGSSVLAVRLRREVHRNLGGSLSPHNAWLQSLGLETLALRIEKSCANALTTAQFLEKRHEVMKVHYPGLESSPFHAIASEQFQEKFGGLLSFELESKVQAFRFMDSLKMIRRATNLNDNKTLVLHPASTIFADYTPAERARMKVGEGMIRLSVGIEEIQDIIDDLQRGFDQL